ncbi:hypothetical protein [Pseudoalteromonas piscicida]|uniref:hypothetical protein n=1 Tax=Pseudoalteromonas piscicida TaxID=43662 RepID=UPI0030B3E7FE
MSNINIITKTLIASFAVSSIHTASANSSSDIERIAVTGSRILSIEAESPSPVTVLDQEFILASGATDISELLRCDTL